MPVNKLESRGGMTRNLIKWFTLYPLGFVVGLIFSILGAVMLFIGLYVLFAILFTIGIIINIVGTGFLM